MIIRFSAILIVVCFQAFYALSNDSDFEKTIASARQQITVNTPSAISLAEQASRIAISSGSRLQLGRAYWMLGYLYEISDNLSLAVTHYHQAALIYQRLDRPSDVAALMEQSGRAKLNFGLYHLALKDYQRALAALSCHPDDHPCQATSHSYKILSSLHYDMGITHAHLRQYDQAIMFFIRVLSLTRLHGDLSDTTLISHTHNEIGRVYQHLATDQHLPHYYDSATLHFHRALSYSSAPFHTFYVRNNLGHMALTRRQLDTASHWLSRTMDIGVTLPAHQAIIPTLNNLAELAFLSGDIHTADSLLHQSIQINVRQYSPDQIIQDLHLPLVLHNTPELIRSYSLLDSIAIGHPDMSALLARVTQITQAEQAARAQEMETTYLEEINHMQKEIKAKETDDIITYWLILGTISIISGSVIYFLSVKFVKASRYKQSIESKLSRIRSKYSS